MPTGRRRQGGLWRGHARGPSSKWVRQPIWQFRRSASHCLTSTPSFTSLLNLLHQVLLLPPMWHKVPTSIIHCGKRQREEIVSHPLLLHHPITLNPAFCPGPPRCLTHIPCQVLVFLGSGHQEEVAGGPARNASCSKVWSIRVIGSVPLSF